MIVFLDIESCVLKLKVKCAHNYVQFNYNFDWKKNGADWGQNFTLCANGKNQSPIDLKDSEVVESDTLRVKGFEYPNFVTNTLSRGGATNMPAGLKSRFEANFGEG